MRWPDRLRAGKPRGWSITSVSLRTITDQRTGDRYLRQLWISRRGGFTKLALWIFAIWGGHSLIASDHGFLHLRALKHEEAALDARHAALVEEHRQMKNEVAEAPAVSIERGLREKYRKSRPGEIVYRTKTIVGSAPSSADSVARSGSAGSRDSDSNAGWTGGTRGSKEEGR